MAENKKKEKKDKKKKKEKGAAVEEERFKPVINPDYNPTDSNNNEDAEKWTIASKRSDIIQPNSPKSPTPAELQGFTAYKYVPSPGYAHLDPSKHKNAHSAFDQLQKVIAAQEQQQKQQSSPQKSTQKKQPKQQQPQPQQQPLTSQQHKVQPQQPRPQQQHRVQQQQPPRMPQTGHTFQQRPPPMPIHQSPQLYQGPPHQQRAPYTQQQQQWPRQPGQPSQPFRLDDGSSVQHYARALWNYNAQMASELSFVANDRFAILNKQPDGWWYAELLDNNRRRRGLVPGNYMSPL
ncbi:hypothetical protein RMCBS344292_16693 [Rhizopus microsporus]|nr:hypothetical protein RMCBS344292_16693 [Rhizopus microsporus]